MGDIRDYLKKHLPKKQINCLVDQEVVDKFNEVREDLDYTWSDFLEAVFRKEIDEHVQRKVKEGNKRGGK